MIRAIWILLVSMALFGATLEEEIISIIGPEKFQRNQAVLNAVFLDRNRYLRNGMVDVVKVVQVLDRIGLIQKDFPTRQRHAIVFKAYSHPYLFFKVAFDALKAADLFEYEIVKIEKNEQEYLLHIAYTSSRLADPVAIARYFAKSDMGVVHIQKRQNSWEYTIDADSGALLAPKVIRKLKIAPIRKAVWIRVENIEKLMIFSALGNRWFPKIFIYDRWLRPVDVVQKEHKSVQFGLKLPKESYYIKISDKFTLKNIKNGLTIVAK